MIAVTGASGQLGRLVIENLLKSIDPSGIAALVRSPEKVKDLAQKGIEVRDADYNLPGTLEAALTGIERVLLISSSEVGQRSPQHANVIEAAKKAGVGLLAYTSILHAGTSPLPLAAEHLETEQMLLGSGLPHVLLRNGWYTENYTAGVPAALTHGVVLGCAGQGRISSAARADYAEAAAAVLLAENPAGKIYELAGDTAYTLEALAAEIAAQSGEQVQYRNLPEAEFVSALTSAGLPQGLAVMLGQSDTGASQNGLFDDSRTLSRLIGRATTPLSRMVAEALTGHS